MGRSMIRRVRFTHNLDSRHSRNLFKERGDLDGTIEASVKHNFNRDCISIVLHIFICTLCIAFSIASASRVDIACAV